MNDALKALFVIVLGVAILWAVVTEPGRQKEKIAKWGDENGCQVIDIDTCWFDTGPWYFTDEDDDVYYVKFRDRNTDKERHAYFLFDLSGMKQAWDE